MMLSERTNKLLLLDAEKVLAQNSWRTESHASQQAEMRIYYVNNDLTWVSNYVGFAIEIYIYKCFEIKRLTWIIIRVIIKNVKVII